MAALEMPLPDQPFLATYLAKKLATWYNKCTNINNKINNLNNVSKNILINQCFK